MKKSRGHIEIIVIVLQRVQSSYISKKGFTFLIKRVKFWRLKIERQKFCFSVTDIEK